MSGHFLEIPPEDCRRMLADVAVARVGWASSDGVQVLPVNLTVDGDAVYLRVDAASVLAELAAGVDVVVEADDIDPDTSTGWSVLARGRAARHAGAPPASRPSPWAPGGRELLIRVDVRELSGRAVSAG